MRANTNQQRDSSTREVCCPLLATEALLRQNRLTTILLCCLGSHVPPLNVQDNSACKSDLTLMDNHCLQTEAEPETNGAAAATNGSAEATPAADGEGATEGEKAKEMSHEEQQSEY